MSSCRFVAAALSVLALRAEAAAAPQARDWLTKALTPAAMEPLVPAEQWHPFPRIDEREAWEAVPQATRDAVIAEAEKSLGAKWEPLPATLFLEYVRNGNRSHYERPFGERRSRLAQLVLAEVFENKGRFLDDIANGIWAISEETGWVGAAHLGLQAKGKGLNDVTEPTIDLYAGETAALFAWTHYLVGERLARVSPLVDARIVIEVRRRVLDPGLAREDFWWMGLGAPRALNNWTPWIASNWLTAVLVLETDAERRQNGVRKIARILDQFLNGYSEDGGCDEGPGYWGHAAGSLFEALELLHSATGGAVDVYDRPLVHQMMQFIAKVHVGSDYFVNFGDASPKPRPPASLVFRMGRRLHDPVLTGFGAWLAARDREDGRDSSGRGLALGRALPALLIQRELEESAPHAPDIRDVYLPDLQFFAARDARLYVASHGGHNGESHNHNDVGDVVVFVDGEPALIDVGVETYTAQTFGAGRYDIWTMQSGFHNLPTVNGQQQSSGREFGASDVRYVPSASAPSVRLDIARAYPSEARLSHWVRTVTLHRGRDVEVADTYAAASCRQPVAQSLMTPLTPDVGKAGVVRLLKANGSPLAQVRYDASAFDAASEEIAIKDERLRSVWGERLFRIRLTARTCNTNGRQVLVVQPAARVPPTTH
jgi:hypothetical protein